jgi:hypothetical protein
MGGVIKIGQRKRRGVANSELPSELVHEVHEVGPSEKMYELDS